MPTVRLTETAIAAATKRSAADKARVEVADASCPGLRLRITPTGARGWVLGCRDTHGAARRFKLGEFPEMGIADARQAARTLRAEVAAGKDPIAAARGRRQQTRDAKAGIGTLAAVLDRYEPVHGRALRRWSECRQRIESVFAAYLDRPIALMRRTDLQLTADSWKAQASAGAAVRYLRPILKWAAARDLVPADAADIKPPAPIKRRDRVLSRSELARLLPVLSGAETSYGPAMLFMLLTATRREESAGAMWRDIDLQSGIWTVPRTKNGLPHQVPLSRQALDLLCARGPGKPTALVFASQAGKGLANWDRATKAFLAAANKADRREPPVERFTRHDLRRTAATIMGELGELPDIIEATLNHVAIRSPLAATYNRSRYRPQVAVALQRLADCLDGIGNGGAEVVPLRRA